MQQPKQLELRHVVCNVATSLRCPMQLLDCCFETQAEAASCQHNENAMYIVHPTALRAFLKNGRPPELLPSCRDPHKCPRH